MPIKRQKKTGGRIADKVLEAYAIRYKLTPKQRAVLPRFIEQLALAHTEEARRLLLGVSS